MAIGGPNESAAQDKPRRLSGPMMRALKQRLVLFAREAGFADIGVCAPGAVPETSGRLRTFVEAGRHGDMAWMAERMGWRGDPEALWPEARAVIMLAEVYTPQLDPMALLQKRDRGVVSCYAQGADYHKLAKARAKRVARWLVAETGAEVKVFVDTAPVMEKPLGQAAGLGWQGKHTNLVSRDLGSWFFLAAVFTTADIETDPPESDHCGSCRACLDVCPTDAFPAPYQLDARRCISYLTIEHKGPVDQELRPGLGNRIYGCDDCLAVCPWNKFAKAATELRYQARPELAAPRLTELAGLDDAGFRNLFAGSPIKRIGRVRFVRNVAYAIGNSGDPGMLGAAQSLCEDRDPVVADAARWAADRLSTGL